MAANEDPREPVEHVFLRHDSALGNARSCLLGGMVGVVMVGVVCLEFLAAGRLQWKGWDIDLDSKTRRLSIKRFGTGS
jgi:hypothetical protein